MRGSAAARPPQRGSRSMQLKLMSMNRKSAGVGEARFKAASSAGSAGKEIDRRPQNHAVICGWLDAMTRSSVTIRVSARRMGSCPRFVSWECRNTISRHPEPKRASCATTTRKAASRENIPGRLRSQRNIPTPSNNAGAANQKKYRP